MKKGILLGFLAVSMVLALSISLAYAFNGEGNTRDPLDTRTQTMTQYGDGLEDCGEECDPIREQKRVMHHQARELMSGEHGEMRRMQECRFGSW